ncbi:MAG: hypothetical protein NWE92_11395 [Candidatus Bathyarchaeota archaeon]|nr:hypothetical protein [Candidatus Bathyarchaeota archaeon]
MLFSVVYGVVFINYIDIASPVPSNGYHLWLVIMYFLPFVGFTLLNPRNWELTLGLGLVASLMNDVFYGALKYLAGSLSIGVNTYYSLWLVPQNTLLFTLNLGFTTVSVFSWMMALSIYLRIAVVVLLLWHWKRSIRGKTILPIVG